MFEGVIVDGCFGCNTGVVKWGIWAAWVMYWAEKECGSDLQTALQSSHQGTVRLRRSVVPWHGLGSFL